MLDLLASIATRRRDEAQARKALEQLRHVEVEPFYLHRLATIELHFGTAESAYRAASDAVRTAPRPTFEMRALLVQASIRTKRFDEAVTILLELDRSKKDGHTLGSQM